jgi:hypothetical protein
MKMGIAKYIDSEIASKVSGLGKWLIPVAGASIISSKVEPMIKQNHEMLKHMGYMTDDYLIDLDKLYADFKRVAHDKGAITESFPLVGSITFTEADIDALRRYMG